MRAGVMPVTATWMAGSVLAWAIRYGSGAGAVAALILGGCDLWMYHRAVPVVLNGLVLLLLAGVIVGHLARLAAEVEAERQHAVQVEAASRERERLARDIHDSVLQVLALVQRRGAEAGGEAAEFGQMAGQLEASLRTLVGPGVGGGLSAAEPAPTSSKSADLRALLLPAQSERVTVAVPAQAVLLERGAAEELAAAVRAALDNVRRHCGGRAQAWVLVEDEPDQVTVTIRDNGRAYRAAGWPRRRPPAGSASAIPSAVGCVTWVAPPLSGPCPARVPRSSCASRAGRRYRWSRRRPRARVQAWRRASRSGSWSWTTIRCGATRSHGT